MKWIKNTFDDMTEVTIKNYDRLCLSCKKVTDCSDDYVIVYYDDKQNKVSYPFSMKRRS
ncbi:hypothetical protein GLW20_03955 [Virgibacillus halodenitrificans]|nr:hypothetical protein [Virgibacillus halodenitrificans]